MIMEQLIDQDEDVDNIFLHAQKYRPGMKITDSDGEHLGFFTNEVTRELLQQSTKDEDKALLRDIDSRKKYIQWIQLGREKSLAKKDEGDTN